MIEKKSVPFRLVIFEEAGSGKYKTAGIEIYGRNITIERIYDILFDLPQVIDEPGEFIPDDFTGDLILNFLRHPDLSEHLVKICKTKGIPVIASGQNIPGAICPFTCCGLEHRKDLGSYGEQFGLPEYDVDVKNGYINGLHVRRGASCGATWQVIRKVIGVTMDEAMGAIGREIQYLCKADPSAFDPLSSKSPLHFAGKVHAAALKRALSIKA
ncbi:MAG: hypothetical protein AVO38_06715 [delta proteobacterium ML8_D]|jgi:thymidylate synthase|nr:MAG: hypothetical protein AVO38_06715 [delta proteobacterium ML8_D]